MIPLPRDEFAARLVAARIKLRLRRTLRYVPEEVTDWECRDFLAVTDRARNEGVLLYDSYTLPFTLAPRAQNVHGRVEAIICDICASWRRGTESAVITFSKGDRTTVSYLVCADLDCSLHVRGLTTAATLSRTQVREHIDDDARVDRLRTRLSQIITNVQSYYSIVLQ